jgi:hypothetical protein
MKKIPTLFERQFADHKVVGITDKVYPGMEWVLEGKGTATVKIDGSCCAIIDGKFYKRYDAKHGKKPPKGAIPCCDPDPVTGHHPHWVLVTMNQPDSKWHVVALETAKAHRGGLCDGTYEAVGPHFQGNPHKLPYDTLIQHGIATIETDELGDDEEHRTFEGIRKYLEVHAIEGIVFWKDEEPRCKIKRSDFGFEWPIGEGRVGSA